MAEHFDLIIIGSGPGGLAAALYAARGRMKTLVLEKGQNGGQAAITHLIENYPGSIEDPTGPKLTHRMLEHPQITLGNIPLLRIAVNSIDQTVAITGFAMLQQNRIEMVTMDAEVAEKF